MRIPYVIDNQLHNLADVLNAILAEHANRFGMPLPIKAQLGRTDALIDQVVYRLYGLSEEEIAVVEGKK